MASRQKYLSELYTQTIDEITSNRGTWQDFLRSACRNYKCPFSEQVLICAQRPYATAVLELEKWNRRFGRWVNKGSTGIGVIDSDSNGRSSIKYYFDIVDWDDPVLAPPERDAWFCLHWKWAIDIFNDEFQKNGMDYILRSERLAYYCYHSFFFYLTEYLSTYLDIGNQGGDMAQKLCAYFDCWIGGRTPHSLCCYDTSRTYSFYDGEGG